MPPRAEVPHRVGSGDTLPTIPLSGSRLCESVREPTELVDYTSQKAEWAYSPNSQACNLKPTVQETDVLSLGREDCVEKEMTTHSSITAWRIL